MGGEIQSNRNLFTGAHLTKEVKDALRRESSKRGISMSEFIFLAIKEKLASFGVRV